MRQRASRAACGPAMRPSAAMGRANRQSSAAASQPTLQQWRRLLRKVLQRAEHLAVHQRRLLHLVLLCARGLLRLQLPQHCLQLLDPGRRNRGGCLSSSALLATQHDICWTSDKQRKLERVTVDGSVRLTAWLVAALCCVTLGPAGSPVMPPLAEGCRAAAGLTASAARQLGAAPPPLPAGHRHLSLPPPQACCFPLQSKC